MRFPATCQKSLVSCKTKTNTLDFANEFKNLEPAKYQENTVNLFKIFIILRTMKFLSKFIYQKTKDQSKSKLWVQQ